MRASSLILAASLALLSSACTFQAYVTPAPAPAPGYVERQRVIEREVVYDEAPPRVTREVHIVEEVPAQPPARVTFVEEHVHTAAGVRVKVRLGNKPSRRYARPAPPPSRHEHGHHHKRHKDAHRHR